MNGAWKDLPFAPSPGRRVCGVYDLAGPIHSVDLDGFPLLLVQCDENLQGYVNACPHQYLPLDWRSSNILSADGKTLRCSNHEAGFDARTGEGVDGFGVGCALDQVPVCRVGDDILIGEAAT